MSCPYLTQVTMVFCRASPVKKLVPSDRITTASTCEGDCYRACPLYREVEEQVGHEIHEFESEESSPPHNEDRKGALP